MYDLPFGTERTVLDESFSSARHLINDWQLSGVFNAESGTPVGLNTGLWYNCPGQSYRPANGTSVRQGHWFNTANASQLLAGYSEVWTVEPVRTTTAQVRNPTIPSLDLSVEKNTVLHDNLNFQLRLDAFNALNTVLFGGPDTNPSDGPATFSPTSGWSGFGTIGATQQNFPRILQVSGKLSF